MPVDEFIRSLGGWWGDQMSSMRLLIEGSERGELAPCSDARRPNLRRSQSQLSSSPAHLAARKASLTNPGS